MKLNSSLLEVGLGHKVFSEVHIGRKGLCVQ